MNKKQKSLPNKGFSLVELIIVIAIYILQILRYVESSRLQKDNQAIAEIANSIKIAMADETINSSIANSASESFDVNASHQYVFPSSPATALSTELSTVVGTTVTMSSNTYSGTAPTIVVSKDANGMITVTAQNYKTSSTAAAITQTF